MKKLLYTTLLAIFAAAFASAFNPAMAGDINALTEEIKNCQGEDCEARLQQEAEVIFDDVGRRFDDDFVRMGAEINVNHCRSLIEEMFYHMDTLKSYYNFKDVFYLEKLQKLKKNRERFDAREINKADFDRISSQIDAQYEQDMKESQEFIDEKVARLKELCSNLNQNVDAVKSAARIKGEPVDESLKNSVLSLRREKVWAEFESASKDGQKIEKAVLSASNNMGKNLIPCLKGMFAGFEAPMEGAIFSMELINRLVNKHQL